MLEDMLYKFGGFLCIHWRRNLEVVVDGISFVRRLSTTAAMAVRLA